MKPKNSAMACIVGVLALVACSPEYPPEKAAQVIAEAKAAMGGDAWNDIQVWYEDGEARSKSGAVSKYEHWADLTTLGMRNVASQGSYMLFDGITAYRCTDAECAPRPAIEGNAIRRGSYATSYGFFFPDRFPSSLQYLGVRTRDGVKCDVVRVTPSQLDPIQVWVDQNSHLIARIVFEREDVRAELSEYRQVEQLLIPFVTEEAGATVKAKTVRFYPAGTVAFTPSDSSASPPR